MLKKMNWIYINETKYFGKTIRKNEMLLFWNLENVGLF